MDIAQIQESIQRCSTETELIYTRMGTSFPSLLSITTETGSSSLSSLKSLLTQLAQGFSGYRHDEVAFFESYNAKNAALFTALNGKMSALDSINERVAAIRSDSEELEIISLNAMVISIKSGEKGRAFSVITDNLKRLSARMINLSNELIFDEKKLVDKNNDLKASFTAVLDAQQGVMDARPAGDTDEIRPLIGEAARSLEAMQDHALQVTRPIREAMSGIQLQDIIRQSIDQVLLALPEVKTVPESASADEKLDQLSLNTELLAVCQRIARDVLTNLESSIRTFAENWEQVHDILDRVEQLRLTFISAYLDTGYRNGKTGGTSLPALLERMNRGFAEYLSRINLYQRGQKNMVRDSSTIVAEVKHLRIVFDTLRPIIARLQHVRITQQIEVAKNLAIVAVKDTVNYMSDLIIRSDSRVQATRKELEVFISDIEELTGNFTAGTGEDNQELERIKQEKTGFFNAMQSFEEELASSIGQLRVYPDSFRSLCSEIDGLLGDLKHIAGTISEVVTSLDRSRSVFQTERERALSAAGLSDWTIKNNRLKDLVERFTITAHKEAAGQIGGFDVEQNPLDTIESGDVTLFF